MQPWDWDSSTSLRALYDKEFVEKWCIGFNELKARAEEYDLDKVEKITWVPKRKNQGSGQTLRHQCKPLTTHSVAIEQNADTLSAL